MDTKRRESSYASCVEAIEEAVGELLSASVGLAAHSQRGKVTDEKRILHQQIAIMEAVGE